MLVSRVFRSERVRTLGTMCLLLYISVPRRVRRFGGLGDRQWLRGIVTLWLVFALEGNDEKDSVIGDLTKKR
jgi:hypothetical protein